MAQPEYRLSPARCKHANKKSVPDGTLNGKPAVATTCPDCGLYARHTK